MEEPKKAVFSIFRGDEKSSRMEEYKIDITPGMVVLDAVLKIQADYAADLGVRCNCAAGKCGSCSAEINGVPRLMCKTRLDALAPDKPIEVRPLKAFPVVKDLVTDVSWNYEVSKKIPFFNPGDEELIMRQYEVDRIQEFRKCIECFLCQDTCHVIREHEKKDDYFGPAFFTRIAGLEMHPLDTEDRLELVKNKGGLSWCNITHCCSEVCPEKIRITDNAIIPMKERVVDRFYDPLTKGNKP